VATPARAGVRGEFSVVRRQAPLRSRYQQDPAAAITVKRVRTLPDAAPDPVHGAVEAVGPYAGSCWPFGTDAKIGGLDDLPNSGHLLCAALAACEDNTIRMVASHLGVQIEHLSVEVVGDVDVRGCLAMDPGAPVGFRSMHMTVDLRLTAGTDGRRAALLKQAAEQLCVNLDTLRRGVPVTLAYTHAEGASS
jgi:uncharacterized OsmC-like protein